MPVTRARRGEGAGIDFGFRILDFGFGILGELGDALWNRPGSNARLAIPLKPGERFDEAVAEVGGGPEAEGALGAGRVEAAAGLAGGFGAGPAEVAAEAGQIADQLSQLANRNFARGADVHRVGFVIMLGRQGDRLGSVADEEKLARGGPRSPDVDVALAGIAGFDDFADERGDHMAR